MKRRIGTFKNTPIVEGNRNDLKEGELLYVDSDDMTTFHTVKSGKERIYTLLPFEKFIELLKNTYKEGYEGNK